MDRQEDRSMKGEEFYKLFDERLHEAHNPRVALLHCVLDAVPLPMFAVAIYNQQACSHFDAAVVGAWISGWNPRKKKLVVMAENFPVDQVSGVFEIEHLKPEGELKHLFVHRPHLVIGIEL
jgi:hypothetical protein